MATQTRERELIIEMKQVVVQSIDLCQEVSEESLSAPTVLVSSETQRGIQAITEHRGGSLGSSIIKKVLAGLARQPAAVYVSLSRPAATERGRIKNAMVKARHDRFISYLR